MEVEVDGPMAHAGSPDDLDYESALADLDAVLLRLEDGRVPLEEAMALYARGVALVRRCSALLDGAEKRVVELSLSADGELVERPFQATPAAEPQEPD